MAIFSTLYDEVLRRAYLDITADANQTTQAKLWVNNSQRSLQMERRWNCLYRNTTFSTVADQAGYTLAARSVPGLLWHEEFGYPREIGIITDKDYVDSNLSLTNTGKPSIYHVTAQSVTASINSIAIELWPIPDAIYTIFDSYYAIAVDMSANSDRPVFPQEFDELLILMGTQKSRRFAENAQADALIRQDIREQKSILKKWDDSLTPNFSALQMRSSGTGRTAQDAFDFPITGK